jgi:hypothetical protein
VPRVFFCSQRSTYNPHDHQQTRPAQPSPKQSPSQAPRSNLSTETGSFFALCRYESISVLLNSVPLLKMANPVTQISRAMFWEHHLNFASPTDRFANLDEGDCMVCAVPLDFTHGPANPNNPEPFYQYIQRISRHHSKQAGGMVTVMAGLTMEQMTMVFADKPPQFNPAVRISPCGHVVCCRCMLGWTMAKSNCLICRTQLYNAGLPQGPPPARQLLQLLQLPGLPQPPAVGNLPPTRLLLGIGGLVLVLFFSLVVSYHRAG